MNKYHRTIWNNGLRARVAVSELGKASGKRSSLGLAVAALVSGIGLPTLVAAQQPPPTFTGTYFSVASRVTADAQATGSGSIAIGSEAYSINAYSVNIGLQSGYGSTGGAGKQENTAVGLQSGLALNGGADSFFGAYSGRSVTGFGNSAFGAGAGNSVTGDSNFAAGNNSGVGITASNTVSIGTDSVASKNDAIAIGTGALVRNDSAIAIGKGAVASNDASVALGAGARTAAAAPTSSGSVGAFTYGGFAGTSPIGVVSMGTVRGERQIINVAAGRITANSTDAVNGSQLFSVAKGLNDRIDGVGVGVGGGSGPVDAVTVNQLNAVSNKWITSNPTNYVAPQAVGPDSTAIGSGATATGANSVALGVNSNDGGRSNVVSVGAAGAERQVTNVAPGTQGTDAVNLNQLNSGLQQSNNYADQRINQLRNDINGIQKDASAGTAAAMAMASMPQAFTPGKSMVAAGVGYYEGQTAVSLGVSRLSDNGRWVMKFNGSANTRGKIGVGAGAGLQW